MNTKQILLVSAAMTALLLGGCTTQEAEPFTQTSIEGSDIQSVPTPLEPVPENKRDETAPAEAGAAPGGPVPPPPPPSVLAVPSLSADSVVGESVTVTGSRLRRGEFKSVSPVETISGEVSRDLGAGDAADKLTVLPGDTRPQPRPQSGLLTAGDYDDVLNPHLYADYLGKIRDGQLAQKGLPYVDAADRIAIRITDRLGKPMPFADIMLSTPQGAEMFPLRTGANGMAYLYPKFDVLEAGTTITVSAEGAKRKSKSLTTVNLEEGGELAFVMERDAAKIQQLDILLTLDATGSMGDEMRYLQTELVSIMTRMEANNPDLDIRAGLVVYRDTTDEYVVRDFDFTDDLEVYKVNLSRQTARGGGDFPEAMNDALTKGLGLSWREDAIKINLLVADAPPHDEKINATWNTALHSRVRGIHVVSLAASGVDPTAEFLMRAMGQLTGGRYLFLTDDSGVGNPHAEPTVDCYVVTPLNGLVQRVFESLVAGTRVEPEGDSVIRTVGSYQAGICTAEPEAQ